MREPVVLRFAVHGNLSLLQGRTLDDLFRKSHFLVFRFEGLDLAVNPMLAGRFRLAPPGERDEAALCFALEFSEDEPVELRYLDDKKMGKAYLIATEDWKAIPGMQTGGIDILSAEFTRERFCSLLKHRRDQVRVFLLDKKALDSLGNAYADEVLFAAGIHPKTFCRSLTPRRRRSAPRRHRGGDDGGRARGREARSRPRGQGSGLPERAPPGDLPALRFQAPQGRGARHGRLLLSQVPARHPCGVRGLDAHRQVTSRCPGQRPRGAR